MYFYNARYYDPYLARFVQADTIVPNPADPQSLNRFSYVLNNPLKYTDPSGHLTDDQIIDYTDYNTENQLATLKEDHPELYWMLRALHPDDYFWAQGWGTYRASLIDGRLFFAPVGSEGEPLEVGDFVGAKYIAIDRPMSDYGIRTAYMWYEGDDAYASYLNRWTSVDTYQKNSYWDYFRKFKGKITVGTTFVTTGAGIVIGGLLDGPLPFGEAAGGMAGKAFGGLAGLAFGIVFDTVVDFAEYIGTPPGAGAGDEIYSYTYDDWIETITIRAGEVIAHDWERH